MKKAKAEGMAFGYVLKLATEAFVRGEMSIQLVAQPKLNEKTRKELIKISEDFKKGKNVVGPFKTVEEFKKHLMGK